MAHTYYMYACIIFIYLACVCVCVCVLSIKCHFVTHSGYILIGLLLDVFVSIRWHFINRACIIHVFIFKHSIKDTANSYADKQQRTQYSFSFPLAFGFADKKMRITKLI